MSRNSVSPGTAGIDAECRDSARTERVACAEAGEVMICAGDNGTGASFADLRRDARAQARRLLRERQRTPRS